MHLICEALWCVSSRSTAQQRGEESLLRSRSESAHVSHSGEREDEGALAPSPQVAVLCASCSSTPRSNCRTREQHTARVPEVHAVAATTNDMNWQRNKDGDNGTRLFAH